MFVRKILIMSVLALAPAFALAIPMTIVSMPTDATAEPGTPFRHNVFHDAAVPGGVGGAVLAWFDLDTSMTSTWDAATGELDLHVSIYADAAQTTLLGTGTGTSNSLFGAEFGGFDNSTLASIDWLFFGADAVSLLGSGLTMQFIDYNYAAASNSAGNVPNSYIGNTVTLWGADGIHDGNGRFDDASLGVDMVFTVANVAAPEPGIILLMAMGLLGIGVSTRKRK